MRTNPEEGGNDCQNILVLDRGDSLGTLMRKAAAIVTGYRRAGCCLELQLTNVKNASQDLANLGNLTPRELELPQSRLEQLKTLGVVDADLQL